MLQQLVIESVMHGQCDTRPTIISCIDSLVASGRAVRIGYYNSDIIDVNKVFFYVLTFLLFFPNVLHNKKV